MKLHLPIILRSALLAVIAGAAALTTAEATVTQNGNKTIWVEDAPEGYRIYFTNCSSGSTSIEYDSLFNKTPGSTTVTDSATKEPLIFNDVFVNNYVYRQTSRAIHTYPQFFRRLFTQYRLAKRSYY